MTMSQTLDAARRDGEAALKRVPFVPFMAIAAASTAAFIVGLLAMLSWPECLVVVFAAAALTGGAVFTVLEMQRLAREGH